MLGFCNEGHGCICLSRGAGFVYLLVTCISYKKRKLKCAIRRGDARRGDC